MNSPMAFSPRRNSAFTLVEMIGVMAIMAILAAVITPNAVKSIDRAAVIAEQQSLHNLVVPIKKYFYDAGVPPASATWDVDVAKYSSLGAPDIKTNRRQMNRVFLLDPDPVVTAFHRRAMILSSMRQGMAIPTALNTNQFDALWRSADGEQPAAASWGGWTAMAADYLVIERINFKTEYQDIVLQNNSNSSTPPAPVQVRYEVLSSSGILLASAVINYTPTTANKVTVPAITNSRINLYVGPTTGSALDYVYVVGTTSKKIDFNGTHWIIP